MTHLDRDTNWHARSRTTMAGAFMLHMLRKCTPVCEKDAGGELKKKLLPKMREERGKKSNGLEGDLQSELRSARAAPSEEGVADTYVAGSGESEVAAPPSKAVEAIACRVCDEVRQVWIGEIGVIENIEELSPELQNGVLGQVCV